MAGMTVEIGKYKVSWADMQRLIYIAKNIDNNKNMLSRNEEIEIEKALDGCKGDVACAEARLRKLVLGTSFIPETIYIPAGTFKMGSTVSDCEQPVRNVKISAFKMSDYEVTKEEYLVFLQATNQETPKYLAFKISGRQPVVYVSWNDAAGYCRWLSKETGRKFRLPTEAEWEYAARGFDGRKYPWGNEWDPSKAVFNVYGSQPVGTHPEGASPFGIMDMAGNVYEWVEDRFAEKYNAKDLINPKGPETGEYRVIRGGSWADVYPEWMRSSHRGELRQGHCDEWVGFRVAEDI